MKWSKIGSILLAAVLTVVSAVPVAAAGTITALPSPFSLIDGADRITVTVGDLVYELYKGSAGYNKLLNNSKVAVYDERVTVEYLSGAQWKQVGSPQSVTYTESSTQYTVSRHYTDFIGTTYSINYKFTRDNPVKMEVDLNSGQTRTYRIVWSASGVTSEYRGTSGSIADFSSIQFDWSDVVSTLGDITTTNVTDVAQGKKFSATFSIGSVSSGSRLILDPTICTVNTDYSAIRYAYQRRIFQANGRYWVFYYSGSLMLMRTSTNGTNWSGATTIRSGVVTADQFDIRFDGTYVHYAVGPNDTDDIRYRRGTPNADGSITWSADEQIAYVGNISYPAISVDSSGQAWLAFREPVTNYALVAKNDNTDGTWSTAAGFPYSVSGTTAANCVFLNSIGSDDMYVLYVSSGSGLKGMSYIDGSWGSAQTVISSFSGADVSSVASSSGHVYVAYRSGFTIVFKEWISGSWSSPVVLYSGADNLVTPATVLFDDDTTVGVIWSSPASDHFYYDYRLDGTWHGTVDWFSDTPNIERSLSVESLRSGVLEDVGFIYVITDASDALRFASLDPFSVPTVTSTDADGVTPSSATLHGTVTDAGGYYEASAWGFEWDTDSGAPYANSWSGSGTYSSYFSNKVQSLSESTTIYWRSYATNPEGTVYSAERSFKTGFNLSRWVIRNVVPVAISASLVILSLIAGMAPVGIVLGIAVYIILTSIINAMV